MTDAIKIFVEEWSQRFKPKERKNIKLEVSKLGKKPQNLPL